MSLVSGTGTPPSLLGPIEVLDPEDLAGIGRGTDILVVDDSPSNLTAYEAALHPLGRRVVLAGSGLEALSRLLEQDFALLILDVSMPEMNGIETARLIRERPRTKLLPIIFITGMTWQDDIVIEAYKLGAFDFVVKPIPPEVLRAKAGVYLQLQERTQIVLRQAEKLRASEQREKEQERLVAATKRLAKLQEVTAALAEAKTPNDVAACTTRLGAEALDADSAVMWTSNSDGSLAITGSHRVPEAYLEAWRVLLENSDAPATRAFRSNRPIWVENVRDFERELGPGLELARAANRVRSFAALPLTHGETVIGVISFSYDGDHEFRDEERAFLHALARTTEQALDRARLYMSELEARRASEAEGRRKDEFLAMLGHELRNPLSAITSALELLKLREAPRSRELTILDRQIEHMNHLVSDLVDISRMTRGKISLRREVIELCSCVAQVVDAVRPLFDKHRHALVIECPEKIFVDADRHRLCQVLGNLLTNAAKYTPDGGRVVVSASAVDDSVTISVRDNGRGMTEPLLSSVFDVFVQGDRTLDRTEGGLGVGLSFVRTIVLLHGGKVTARSPGLGAGSTFEISWPRATGPTQADEPLVLPKVPRDGSRLRVLVVDDNSDAADLLAEVIRVLGQDATVAYGGEPALELAAANPPDVALLDIGMPGLDGYALASRLRELPGCADTVLIAVTGYGQASDVERSRRAGFAQHVVKPVEIHTLAKLLGISR